MKEWVRELKSQLDREVVGFDVPIIVVGNKSDLESNR
jgi:GTPase SAR1 family protein|tara:strand:+ start:205 stop:315 length:111 start_codon:yes stop_codon:yes gene_type:complete